jgi:hypothetical protein
MFREDFISCLTADQAKNPITMQQFKISEEGYKKMRKKWLIFGLPIAAAIAAIIIVINISNSIVDQSGTLISLPIFLAVMGFSVYRNLKKQKQFALSYSITISDSEISREQTNTPPLSINFMEIKEIVKTEKGGFTIKGRTRTDIIYVPYIIDNPQELEQRLANLAPITVMAKDPFYKKYRFLLTFLFMGAMVSVYAVTNKIIVGICGVLVTGLLLWAFYEIRISKNAPENTKRFSWFFLLIVISIIYVTYMKLTAAWPGSR